MPTPPSRRSLAALATCTTVLLAAPAANAELSSLGSSDLFTPPPVTVLIPRVDLAELAETLANVHTLAPNPFRDAVYREVAATRLAQGIDADGSAPAIDLTLQVQAQRWADHAAATGVLTHDPNVGMAVEMLAPAKSPEEAVSMWLHSTTGHREELLREGLKSYGIGAAQMPDGYWAVVYRGTPEFR
ncbi:CAP domain-containing protein [Staphylococcus chromogenes]|nr:CAP domain-containing protein [Staphylococcus chromogenes]